MTPRHTSAPPTAHTRVVGIFGDPMEHSLSPAMHNAAFAALRLDYVYVAFRVAPAALAAAVRSLRALDIAGVNVTVPHKERVIRHLDSLSPLAQRAGAVNTIVNRDGHLHGDNTDVHGFAQSLRGRGVRLRGRTAIVVGAGGAARAALLGLAQLGVVRVRLINRTARRGRALARALGDAAPLVEHAGLEALREAATFAGVPLVVNSTSLGWGGERFPPLHYAAAPDHCLFYDLAYGRDTDFLRRARRIGRPTLDGSEMLVQQGALAFHLWTGRRAPVIAMRTALSRK